MVDQQHVQQVYLHLIHCATSGQTTSYRKIAKALDPEAENDQIGEIITPVLDRLCAWLKDKSQPMVTALVVRESGADEGLPGRGFWTSLDLDHVDKDAKCKIHAFMVKSIFAHYDALSVNRRSMVDEVSEAIQRTYAAQDERAERMNEYLNVIRHLGTETRLVTRDGTVRRENVLFNVLAWRWLKNEGIL